MLSFFTGMRPQRPRTHSGSLLVSAALLLGALTSGYAEPQLVLLKTGERVIGEVLPESNAEVLVLRSALLGELRLPRVDIVSVEAQPTADPASPELARVEEAATVEPESGHVTKPTQVLVVVVEETVEEVVADTPFLRKFLDFKGPESWKGSLKLGLNLGLGDNVWTETHVSGNLEIQEEGSPHFYRLRGSYTYRETENQNGDSFRSRDNYDASATYRRDLNDKWFLQNALGWRADQMAGIDREVQDLLGIGYRFKPGEDFQLLIGGGGGIEDYQTAFEDDRTGVSPVMNVFQELTWRPWNRTSLVQKFNYYWNPEDAERFNYVFSAAVRLRLTDLIGLEFSYNRNFDNDLGNGLSRDDSQWRNALVVYF